jgi:hypothetical protein
MKTTYIVLISIKDSDGWHELATALDLSEEQRREYFEFGEYASLELKIDENLNVVGGKFLRVNK